MTSCTPYITKKIVKCYCAKYDLNTVKRTEDYIAYPVEYCHKMHGFILEDFKIEFEPTSMEREEWYRDITNSKAYKKAKKKWRKK